MNFSSKYTLPVAALVITVLTAGHYALNLNGQLHFLQMYTTPNFEASSSNDMISFVSSSSAGMPSCINVPLVCCNGIVDIGEECDDGNTVDTDACKNDCTEPPPVASCGNGTEETGEECDDGNIVSGDGCDSTCRLEIVVAAVCGDGTLDLGEQCDDRNTVSGDGCDSTCRIETVAAVCGNDTEETGEECDDGNTADEDGCSSTCLDETCNQFDQNGPFCPSGKWCNRQSCLSRPFCSLYSPGICESCGSGQTWCNTCSGLGADSECPAGYGCSVIGTYPGRSSRQTRWRCKLGGGSPVPPVTPGPADSFTAECVNAAFGFTCAGAALNTQPVIDSCVSNAETLCLTRPGGVFTADPETYNYSRFFPICIAEQTVSYTCAW